MASVYKKDAVYELLRQNILSGVYIPGQQFPKELDFARQLGVAFNTLRSALGRLEKEHLIVRLRGQGTFVSDSPVNPKLLLLYVTSDDRSYPWHQILPHLIEETTRHQIDVTSFDYYEFSNLTPDQVARYFAQEHIFATVILGNSFNGSEPVIDLLKSRKLPVIIAPAYDDDSDVTGFASVVMDVRNAWKKALEHLRNQGFRRVMTQVFDGKNNCLRKYTPEEYHSLLRSLGLEDSEDLWLITPPHDHQALHDTLIRKLSPLKTPPQAILCFTDFTANVVYQTLQELKLRIPDDIAVMGFCGALKGNMLQPSLTTIDLHYRNMAEMIIQMILTSGQWFNPRKPYDDPLSRTCSFSLHTGISTACAGKAE